MIHLEAAGFSRRFYALAFVALTAACASPVDLGPAAEGRSRAPLVPTVRESPVAATFLPPLSRPLPTVVAFDASLAAVLRIEICVLESDECIDPPIRVFSGPGEIRLKQDVDGDAYVATWDIDQAQLPAGGAIRIGVYVGALQLTAIDIQVSTDNKLRTASAGEPIGSASRTLPIRFWVGRTALFAAQSLYTQRVGAVEIARVLEGEFGEEADAAARILAEVGFGASAIAEALRDVFELQAQPTAAVLKGIGVVTLETAEAMKDVFELQAQPTAEVLKAIGVVTLETAEAMKDVFELQAQPTAEILKAIGVATPEIAEALRDVFGLDSDAVDEILRAIGADP